MKGLFRSSKIRKGDAPVKQTAQAVKVQSTASKKSRLKSAKSMVASRGTMLFSQRAVSSAAVTKRSAKYKSYHTGLDHISLAKVNNGLSEGHSLQALSSKDEYTIELV